MKTISKEGKIEDLTVAPTKSSYKNRREEIVAKYVTAINILRDKKYKPITAREVALRLDMNPKTAKDNGEADYVYSECMRKQNFAKFFVDCPMNKKFDLH